MKISTSDSPHQDYMSTTIDLTFPQNKVSADEELIHHINQKNMIVKKPSVNIYNTQGLTSQRDTSPNMRTMKVNKDLQKIQNQIMSNKTMMEVFHDQNQSKGTLRRNIEMSQDNVYQPSNRTGSITTMRENLHQRSNNGSGSLRRRDTFKPNVGYVQDMFENMNKSTQLV